MRLVDGEDQRASLVSLIHEVSRTIPRKGTVEMSCIKHHLLMFKSEVCASSGRLSDKYRSAGSIISAGDSGDKPSHHSGALIDLQSLHTGEF
jgi:hypothetical protein